MSTRRSRGVTLVELIVFMIIVGVAMAGVLAAFNTMTKTSSDPEVRKQVLAIAESLMEEVTLMPFTYCDPDDANAATATSATLGAGPDHCASWVEALGPETQSGTQESRYGNGAPPLYFDNVNDYNGFAMGPGIQDITNTTITGLGAYSASIAVTSGGPSSPSDAAIPSDAGLLISITVTGPGGVSRTLESYRTRYAPNTAP